MRFTVLLVVVMLQAAGLAPALAEELEGCENPCPSGEIYSVEEGRCVPIQVFV